MELQIINVGTTKRFLPDVTVPTSQGKIQNKDLPEEYQMWIDIEYASSDEQDSYQVLSKEGKKNKRFKTSYKRFKCFKEKIKGFSPSFKEFFGIETIEDLKRNEKNPLIAKIISHTFFEIIGYLDDEDSEEETPRS
jgi:hypothetical protein